MNSENNFSNSGLMVVQVNVLSVINADIGIYTQIRQFFSRNIQLNFR
jgi:hypothetical protein